MTDSEIIVGTYEEFLLGYKIKQDEGFKSVQSFATHAHTSSVRCVATNGKYLASGGTDDKIIIYDLINRTEHRVLMYHNGTINTLAMTENGTHVLSGSSDGSIYITRTGNWQVEKIWNKAHKGSAIISLAIHPSNKLALTIGDDHTLRTWNLVKGRQAYAVNLASKGILRPLTVEWEPNGNHFSLTGYNAVTVWDINDAAVKKTLECPSKSVCMVWVSSDIAAVGLENGQIMLFNIESDTNVTFEAHTQRVKDIKFGDNLLYSASSSGHIKVWKLNMKKLKLTEKCTINTGCRITCMILTTVCTQQIKDEKSEPVEILDISKIDEESSNATKNFMPYVTVEIEDEAKLKNKTKKGRINKKKMKLRPKNKKPKVVNSK